MSGKHRAPTRAPEQTTVGPEQQHQTGSMVSNQQAVSMLPMPPALPSLGFEILDLLDESLGEAEVDLGPMDHSGNGVAAEPTCEPNGAPTPPIDPASCPPLDPKDANILHQLAELLTYSRYTDRITQTEIQQAQGLVGTLSPCAYEQFLQLRGGVLADRLLNNPEGEGWATNVVGNAADNPGGLYAAAAAWWQGDEALEVAQAGMGGSIEGVTLDTSKDNSVGVATDLARSKLTVTVPNLSIASMRHASDGATVTSGPGTVLHSVVTLDLPDQASAGLTANVDIESVDWSELRVVTDAMTATIPRVVLTSIRLAAIQASIDPQVVAKATVAPALAKAAMTTQMARLLIPQLNGLSMLMAPLMLGATKPAQDAEMAMREAFELGSVDAMDVGMSIGSISIPGGVSVTQRTSDGASTTTQVDGLHIENLNMALMQVDRLDALKNEAYNLSSQMGPLDPLDQARLDSIYTQIDELEPKAARRATLEQKAQSGSLTTEESTELTLLARDLSAGMLKVTMDSLDVHGISTDGNQVDDVTVMDLDVTAMGGALAYRLQDQATPQEALDTRRASMDALVARHANAPILPDAGPSDAPLWSLPESMEDLGFSGTAGLIEAGGVNTAYGSADHAAAESVDFRGNGDVLGVQARDLQADGLNAMGLTADHVQGRSADIRVRGNDVGGAIHQASGQGIHYQGSGMDAEMQTGRAQTIRFDADAGEQRLRTGHIAHAEATGLEYSDAGQRVVAASASAESIAARGANATGIDELTVASGTAQEGSYRRNAAPARVGEDGKAIEAVTGMDAAFDTARLEDLRVSDATTVGSGTVSLASLEVRGVSGGMDGMGTASADVVRMQSLNATRDADGQLDARIDALTAEGAIGQIPGTAYASADDIAIHDITASADAAGNYSARGETGSIEGVHVLAPGVAEGTVDSIDLAGLHGGMQSDGSLSAGADLTTATGIDGEARGYGQGSLDSLTLQGAEGHLNADGTGGVSTRSGEMLGMDGIYGESVDPTATGHVDRVGFGYAGANFDEEYNVTGAEVNDLEGAGISVELLKLPLDERSEEPPAGAPGSLAVAEETTMAHIRNEPAASDVTTRMGPSASHEEDAVSSQDVFHADAMAGMNGTLDLVVPTTPSGLLTIHAAADSGCVDLSSIRIHWLPTDNVHPRVPVTFKVEPGRGLVVKFLGTRLAIALDDRDYAGLVSHDQPGAESRRGTVMVQDFIEGVMNGVTTPLSDDPELAELQQRRRDARDTSDGEELQTSERVQRRKRRQDDRRVARGRESRYEPPTIYDDSIQGTIDGVIDSGMMAINLPLLKPIHVGVHLERTEVHTSMSLGEGQLGYDSMSVQVAAEQEPSFIVSGTLDRSMQASTQRFDAETASITSVVGAPLELERIGLAGVDVNVHHPLYTARRVNLNVQEGSIASIEWGEGATNDQE